MSKDTDKDKGQSFEDLPRQVQDIRVEEPPVRHMAPVEPTIPRVPPPLPKPAEKLADKAAGPTALPVGGSTPRRAP